ncbi:hypothetical protein GCM10009754_07080 [Amycolatopsis minnesotensis]|uniref:Secreted protein n=1 Tax=Amycolatopsis minnesotensis TaxID=337894 RepID=A0ABN2Q2Q7_9PSEU
MRRGRHRRQLRRAVDAPLFLTRLRWRRPYRELLGLVLGEALGPAGCLLAPLPDRPGLIRLLLVLRLLSRLLRLLLRLARPAVDGQLLGIAFGMLCLPRVVTTRVTTVFTEVGVQRRGTPRPHLRRLGLPLRPRLLRGPVRCAVTRLAGRRGRRLLPERRRGGEPVLLPEVLLVLGRLGALRPRRHRR